MNLWQEYKRPTTITEAVQALASASGSAMPIAGGTDLMLDLKQGRHNPIHTLVDLTFIPEISALEVRGDSLFIGAAVPVNRIARDPLTGTHAQALVEACHCRSASPQYRHPRRQCSSRPPRRRRHNRPQIVERRSRSCQRLWNPAHGIHLTFCGSWQICHRQNQRNHYRLLPAAFHSQYSILL